jgi:hypothetical protein
MSNRVLSKVKPLTPQEVSTQTENEFPEWVIIGVNNSIKKNFRGKDEFTIKQKDILNEILSIAPKGTTKEIIYEKRYLDFEKMYKKFGWKIIYDKPGYNETYEPFFIFKPITLKD